MAAWGVSISAPFVPRKRRLWCWEGVTRESRGTGIWSGSETLFCWNLDLGRSLCLTWPRSPLCGKSQNQVGHIALHNWYDSNRLQSWSEPHVYFFLCLFFRRADDEFVLVLPSRTHTGGAQPRYTLWGEKHILLIWFLSGRPNRIEYHDIIVEK